METLGLLNPVEGADGHWKSLFKVGGIAALLMALFIPIQLTVFVLWPPPATVAGWFALFQSSRLIGLLDMDLLLIVDQVFMILIFLALYFALRRASPSAMAIAVVLGIGSAVTYFASTSAFEMLSLSGKYTAAATEAEKAVILAAGEVMLANWQGTAFNVSYVMAGIALLVIAIVMVRSKIFGKAAAYTAVILGVMALLPPTAGTVGMIFSLGSLLPLEIWAILVGLRFLRISGQREAE